jgi:hypothetical protein
MSPLRMGPQCRQGAALLLFRVLQSTSMGVWACVCVCVCVSVCVCVCVQSKWGLFLSHLLGGLSFRLVTRGLIQQL